MNEANEKLVEYANVPIATPSANISGKPSGTSFEKVMRDFEGNVDFLEQEKVWKSIIK